MEFTVYIALAFVLFAIREATNISNRFIPLVAVVLGVGYTFLSNDYKFEPQVILDGLQLALYGVGSVASVKYFLTKQEREEE